MSEGRKGISQQREEEKKKRRQTRLQHRAHLAERHSVHRFKKRADPPAFVNERGSHCTYEGKGAVSGEKEKRKKKKYKPGGKGAARAKKGTPSRLQARGGPCAPVRNGERSGGRRKKRNLTNRCALLWTLVGGEEPEKWQTWSDHA